MKKILSVFMAVVMMMSFVACSSLPKEEKAFIGLWNASYVEVNGELEAVPSAYCAMDVKKDKTAAVSTVGGEGQVMAEELTWEYAQTTEGGMYVYKMVNTAGGTLIAAYSPEDNQLVLMTSETTSILFEKVE